MSHAFRRLRHTASRHRRLLLEQLEDRSLLTAGVLDPTFGNGGIVTSDFGGPGYGTQRPAAVAPDGKLVVGGAVAQDGTNVDFLVARYNADGTLDGSFGTAGRTTIDFGSYYEHVTAVAVQPDGKIVVVGGEGSGDGHGNGMDVARLNSDGTLDTSFNGNGKQLIDFGYGGDAAGVTLTPDGSILVYGSAFVLNVPFGGVDFAVARLTPTGQLDTRFGSGGLQTIDFSIHSYDVDGNGASRPLPANAAAKALTVRPDGSILVVGSSVMDPIEFYTSQPNIPRQVQIAEVKLTPNGQLDESFGPFDEIFGSTVDFYYRLTGVRPGRATIGLWNDFAFPRGGNPANYGPTLFNGFVQVGVAAFDSEGRALVVCLTQGTNNTMPSVVRLSSDGSLDTTFGNDGVSPALTEGLGSTIAVSPDGRIVLGGSYYRGPDDDTNVADFAVGRLTSSGQIDSTFGNGGVTTVDFGHHDSSTGLAVQANGDIVLAGISYGDDGTQGPTIALARVIGHESLDPNGDEDADGIANSVDTQPTIFSNDFSDVANGGATTGSITTRGDQILTIVDAENPADGLLITADASGGTTPAAINVEGTTIYLDAAESVTVTHGSVIVSVITGVVEVIFAATGGPTVATASLSAGEELTFEPETVTFIAAPTNEEPVEVVLIGENGQEATATFSPGNQITFIPETFDVVAPATNEAPVSIVVSTGEVITANPGTTAHAAVQNVLVNILPESLNLDSNGVLTVLIYGAADLSAANIDVSTVRFAGAAATQSSLLDANHDGKLDLQLKFRRQDTGLLALYEELLIDDHDVDGVLDATRQVASVSVTGQTLDDQLFTGSDDLTLFLSGKSLRNLLDDLFG